MPRLLLALLLAVSLAAQKNYDDGKLAYSQGKFQEAEWSMAAALEILARTFMMGAYQPGAY